MLAARRESRRPGKLLRCDRGTMPTGRAGDTELRRARDEPLVERHPRRRLDVAAPAPGPR